MMGRVAAASSLVVAAGAFHTAHYQNPKQFSSTALALTTWRPPFFSSASPRADLEHRFQAGDSYTWLYRRTSDGAPSSWEKYTVAQVEYPLVVLEMATKFREEDEYKVHHRMTVDLERQLNAVFSPSNWKLEGFEYYEEETGEWIRHGPGNNVVAFEEKFNVFLLGDNNHNWLDRIIASKSIQSKHGPTARIARPWRHRYTEAWYGCQPSSELAGVALKKDFGEFTFSLVEQQRKGVVSVFEFVGEIE